MVFSKRILPTFECRIFCGVVNDDCEHECLVSLCFTTPSSEGTYQCNPCEPPASECLDFAFRYDTTVNFKCLSEDDYGFI